MRKIIPFFMSAIIVLFGSSVYAQVTIGKLVPPDQSAVLQVISSENNKGVLFPEMTSEQRDSIVNPAEGLIIYNTDESCLDTWDGSAWVSICGGVPIAQASITNCSAIAVGGTYIAGTPLTTADYLSIPVTVTSVRGGSYSILATTDNGYFFTAEGTFPGAGTYNVNVTGAGSPTTATPSGSTGDSVTITINNMQQTCTPVVKVMPATPDYTIIGVQVFPTTPYIPGQPVDSTRNYLLVTLNVKIPGKWNLYASSVNGYHFTAQGEINSNGAYPQIVNVIAPASGMPVDAGSTDNFILTNPGSATPSNYPFIVHTASVSYSADCGSAEFNGSMQQGIPIKGSEYITLPINVAVIGEVPDGITATGAGLSFKSGPLNFTKLGNTSVTLKPAGTPTPISSGVTSFTLTGEGLTSTCYLTNSIKDAIAVLDFISYSYTNNGTNGNNDGRWVMTKSINPSDTINPETPQNILVNVTVSGSNYGSYNLTTEPENGVSYSASGSFSAPGTYTIALKPAGTPKTYGTVLYKLTGNGIDATIPMSYSYRRFNVLSYTSGGGYGFYNNNQATAILGGSGTFGPGGKVPCQAIPSVINYTSDPSAANLANAINTSKADILYCSYVLFQPGTANADVINVIKDFVFNKHGILLFCVENPGGANTYETLLTNGLFNTTLTSPIPAQIAQNSATLRDNGSEIVNGPFGNLDGLPESITLNIAAYVPAGNTIPNSIVTATCNSGNASNGQILSFQHTKLGVWMCFDSNFNRTTMPTDSYDSKTGVPNLPTASATNNSALFANVFAWAVKYGAYNTVPSYQVSAAPEAGLAYPSSFVPRK
jgi:hypothetical protein